jgi:hypothetical protein
MKRPQFGLRLWLPVLTWFAVLFAWRTAVIEKARREEDRTSNRETMAQWNRNGRPVAFVRKLLNPGQ